MKMGELQMKRYLSFLLATALCLLLIIPMVQAAELEAEEKNAIYAALLDADIATLRQAIDTQLITCEELTAYYLQRIDTYNETYNCFITLCDDALEKAREKDQLLAEGKAEGLLFGIPIVVKDNIHVEGYLTTNGLKKSSSKVSTKTAEVVENLLAEGAIILGKTNLRKEADSAENSYSYAVGHTKNAYNPNLSPGGSSGGSAVATSLNFAAASLGTDTRSSLRIPAALNGCVALRPSKGLVSQDGLIVLSKRRDTAGAITRTVLDQAIMLDAMLGTDFTENLNSDALEGLRIGILKNLADNPDADPEVIAAFQQAVENLKSCSVTVIEVTMPKMHTLAGAVSTDTTKKPIEAFNEAFQDFLKKKDIAAVIFPTYMHTPHYIGTDENGKNWDNVDQEWINNCKDLSPGSGSPEISIPIGTHSRGAGIGMEITAARGCDQLLLDIAYSYTQRFDHRVIPAGTPDLYADFFVSDLQTLVSEYEAGTWPIPETVPTEPPTEPTTVPTTVPATEAPTTAPETVPSTAAPTSLTSETQPAEEKTPDYATLAVSGAVAAISLGSVIVLLAQHRKKEQVSQ